MSGIWPGKPFLHGNKYFSSMLTCEESDKLKKEGSSTTPKEEGDDGGTLSEEENIALSPSEMQSEEPKENDSSDDKPKGRNTRVFGDLNKSIVCRNCGEIGHMERRCPNEIKKEHCKLCGHKDHKNEKDVCSFVLCYKCNHSGHIIKDCKLQNIIVCNQCNFNGHYERDCLAVSFSKHSGHKDALCLDCYKQDHIFCDLTHKQKKVTEDIVGSIEKDFDNSQNVADAISKQVEENCKLYEIVSQFEDPPEDDPNCLRLKEIKKQEDEEFNVEAYTIDDFYKPYLQNLEDGEIDTVQISDQFKKSTGFKMEEFLYPSNPMSQSNPLFIKYHQKVQTRLK